jgi:hypothetical protein
MAACILLNAGLAEATTGCGQIDSLLCLLTVLALYFGWKERFWLAKRLCGTANMAELKYSDVFVPGGFPHHEVRKVLKG